MEMKSGYIETEGDSIFFKTRGKGKAILFIAPGGGDGDNYLAVADILAEKYKVITYDRRANARSSRNFPNEFSIRQQSRDAMAVLKACGESEAVIIGNSSGAVIALDIVTSFPENVELAIIHEAPLAKLLPKTEAEKWTGFFKSCYKIGKKFGSSVGATKFFFGIQMPAVSLIKASQKSLDYAKNEITDGDVNRISSKEATDILIFNELLPVTNYKPDFEKLIESASKIIVACGEYGISKNRWYAKASKNLSNKIGCRFSIFPGNHASFMDTPEIWAEKIFDLLN